MGDADARSATPPVTVAIVEAVAAREGVDETTLPPLGDVIDPDALNALFLDGVDTTRRRRPTVSFRYCGYEITIGEDRAITLE